MSFVVFTFQLWTRAVSWSDISNGQAKNCFANFCVWKSSADRWVSHPDFVCLPACWCLYVCLFCENINGSQEKLVGFLASFNDKSMQIGHFRVTFCLWIKTSLRAKPFIWKWVSPALPFSCKSDLFLFEWFRTRTRFENEAKGN